VLWWVIIVLGVLVAGAHERADADLETSPKPGPGVIVMDQLSMHYGPVTFDHALHAGMAEMTGQCSNCHHDIGSTGIVAACRTCHSPTPNEKDAIWPGLKGAYHRQCLSCHKDWAHENACGFCHTEVAHEMPAQASPHELAGTMPESRHLTMPTTFMYMTDHEPVPVVTFHHEDHAKTFGLSCADCHRGASCDTCHGPEPMPPTVRREETCLACHANKQCVFCHGLGEHRRFDHVSTTGWSLEPEHAGIPCAGCHGPDPALEPPPSQNCRACHRAGDNGEFDHAALGVPLLGDHAHFDCVKCHHGHAEPTKASCTDCHPGQTYTGTPPGWREPEDEQGG